MKANGDSAAPLKPGHGGADTSGLTEHGTVRRRFGRRLLVGLPLLAAVMAAHDVEHAEAGSASDSWKMEGNNNVDDGDFIGSKNNKPLVFKTNNNERLRIGANGTIITSNTIAVNVANPQAKLHLVTANNAGIRAEVSDASMQTTAVQGISVSTSGTGVLGEATATSGSTYGVYGRSAAQDGVGVCGENTSFASGSIGVAGIANQFTGIGVKGEGGVGVVGVCSSAQGAGVRGYATNAAVTNTHGVYGESASIDGKGVVGHATDSTSNTTGVWGRSDSTAGTGVYGSATATSGSTYGVVGYTESTSGVGVSGVALAKSGVTYGVVGFVASPTGNAVYGSVGANSANAMAIYGNALGKPNAFAGYFVGKVHVNGTLSKSGGSFKIDHPLDPENKYLSHSFVESPEMLNIYRGVTTLDASGRATVTLPDWFEALNNKVSYQLTPIGAAAPELHIQHEVADNRFVIAGGQPGQKVCWLVTGVRQDAWARAHPIPVEEDKPAGERGTLLNPVEHGYGEQRGLAYKHARNTLP